MTEHQTEVKEKAFVCKSCGTSFVPTLIFNFYPDKSGNPESGLCEDCFLAQATTPETKEPAPIPSAYESEVCKADQGESACRFLGFIPGEGSVCLKRTAYEAKIARRLSRGTMEAQGDNCSGQPDFIVPK